MNLPLIDLAELETVPLPKFHLFDTHTHVASAVFDNDQALVLERAGRFGVKKMLIIGAGAQWEGNDRAQALCRKLPHLNYAAGLHPHDAAIWKKESGEQLQSYFQATPRPLAVGETGLDYHYNFAPRAKQQEAFSAQLQLAEVLQLPFIVHTREAHDDTLAILKNFSPHILKHGGIIHCFSEAARHAKAYLELGMHLSFSGIITFGKAQDVRDALKITPHDRLLIETDAPYLAPLPFRGKRNEPALLHHTARRAGQELGISAEKVAELTFENAKRLFKLP